jgi:hypothetical protein
MGPKPSCYLNQHLYWLATIKMELPDDLRAKAEHARRLAIAFDRITEIRLLRYAADLEEQASMIEAVS